MRLVNPELFEAARYHEDAPLAAPFRNASRSALIVAASVVGMPCGKSEALALRGRSWCYFMASCPWVSSLWVVEFASSCCLYFLFHYLL